MYCTCYLIHFFFLNKGVCLTLHAILKSWETFRWIHIYKTGSYGVKCLPKRSSVCTYGCMTRSCSGLRSRIQRTLWAELSVVFTKPGTLYHFRIVWTFVNNSISRMCHILPTMCIFIFLLTLETVTLLKLSSVATDYKSCIITVISESLFYPIVGTVFISACGSFLSRTGLDILKCFL